MVEDKYIGLLLAMSSSLAIGTSFIITKKGLNDAGRNNEYVSASENLAYLKNPIWWAGMSTMVIGEAANFAAYLFAPPILVTPLGALSVLIGAVLASFLLKEELGHIGRVGCALCLIGSLIIVLNAPADKEIETVDEILTYAVQPGFLMYLFTVTVFTLFMVYTIAPRYGKTNPIVYISICSVVGSVSIMAIKGFGVALKLTLSGSNQFTHPSTYLFGIVVVLAILIQMNYLNKALDIFATNVVNPMYYVGFSTATIVASMILFQGLNTSGGVMTVSLICGFIITFLGVHLLNISRIPEPVHIQHRRHSSALANGIMNPRVSITGRVSLDGWSRTGTSNGHAGYDPDGAPYSATHGRHSSLYRQQSSTLFNAFGDDDELGDAEIGESVGLTRLREEPGEEDDEEDEPVAFNGVAEDERTLLPSKRDARDRLKEHNHLRESSSSQDRNRSPRTSSPRNGSVSL